MISTAHAGQHVHIRPGVVIGVRHFLPDEEGEILQEHTHNTGGAIITIVRLADNEEIPFFADELISEDSHTMLDNSRRGEKVRTITAIETCHKKLRKGQEGEILYAQENNIGKVLIHVQWEDIGQYPVFLHEIESIPTGGPL